MKKIFVLIASLALGLAFFVPVGNVSAATKAYDYQLISQSSYPSTLNPGETTTVSITLRNTGTETWYDKGVGALRLGSGSSYGNINQQKDYPSEFYDYSTWLSNNRPASLSSGPGLLPGFVTTLTFDLKAPSTPGIYKAYFTPVIDGVAWMKDMGIYWQITVAGNEPSIKNNYYYEDANGNQNLMQSIDVATGVPSGIVIPINGNLLTASNNGVTYKIHEGDKLQLQVSSALNGNMPNFDSSVLGLSYQPDTNCVGNNPCITMPTYPIYTFQAVNSGYSKIEWNSGTVNDFYINVIVDCDYYSYDGSTVDNELTSVKQGDIIIVKLRNPGDGGYVFGDAQVPSADRVQLIAHDRFSPTSGLIGDFGFDQWVFQILDNGSDDWIQIISYRPWEYQPYDMSTYTKVFDLYMNPTMACGSQYFPC